MRIQLNLPPKDFYWNKKSLLTVYWIFIYSWSESQPGRQEYIIRDDSVGLFLEVDASEASVIDSRPSRFWDCVKTEFMNGDMENTSAIIVWPDCWTCSADPNDYRYRFLWERPDSAEFLEFSKIADSMDTEFE